MITENDERHFLCREEEQHAKRQADKSEETDDTFVGTQQFSLVILEIAENRVHHRSDYLRDILQGQHHQTIRLFVISQIGHTHIFTNQQFVQIAAEIVDDIEQELIGGIGKYFPEYPQSECETQPLRVTLKGNHEYQYAGYDRIDNQCVQSCSAEGGGALAKLALRQLGVNITAYTSQVGPIKLEGTYSDYNFDLIETNDVRCPDPEKAKEMADLIYKVKGEGDTIGGTLTCVIKGCPIGLGQPVFGKLHAALGNAMLSINAAKAFEYGEGFKGLKMKGSEQNDVFYNNNGRIETHTNHSGGIQGGLSNGQDIYFRVVFKPIATLLMEQETVNIDGVDTTLKARGRHDACVLPRAVPIVEAMAAMTILDYYLLDKTTQL